MKKKFLLLFMLMCISILAFMPTNVLGITPTRTYGVLTYRIIDDSYIFIINCDTSATNVVIPEQIGSLPVTKISSSTFNGCVNLESVSIPKSVNLMEVNTFSRCDKLTTIWWNPRYIRNDYQTFSSEDNICGNAGIDGDGLKVFFGDSVESIPAYLFANNLRLESVSIGKNVKSIGEGAFSGCTGLTNITIPDSVTSIGNSAFFDCTGLVQIDWNAKKVEDFSSSSNVFKNAGASGDGINVVFGDDVEYIPVYLFDRNLSLELVSIGKNVKSISEKAFYRCSKLKVINVDNYNANYCSIDGNLFIKDKTKLIQYTIGKNDTHYDIPDSVTSIGSYAFYGCSGLASITIPESVTTIGSSAFSNCSGLTSITIPESVTSIGSFSFSGCSGLTSINIPESVTSIGNSAFYNCTGLAQINWNAKKVEDFSSSSNVFSNAGASGDGINVVFDDSVEYIPAYLFYDVSKIKNITIPNSVTSIGNSAFYNCTGLAQINWNAKKVEDFSSSSNVFSNAGASGDDINVVFDDSVEYIPAYLFYDVSKIKNITIPNSVTSIGNSAFSGCGLTSIIIPNSVTSIGSYAFSGCGLTSIIIPFIGQVQGDGKTLSSVFGDSIKNSLKSLTLTNETVIPDYAFKDYTNLTDITLNNGIISIGKYAFSNCTSLTNITTPFIGQVQGDGKTLFDSNIKNSLKSLTLTNETVIPDNAFSGYENLTDITLNDGITSIGANAFDNCGYANDETNWDGECLYLGNYLIGAKPTVVAANVKDGTTVMIDGIFEDCTDLLKVTLPESMINISNNAFNGCTDLFSITLPSNIKTIGKSAFYNCNKITKINIPNSVTKIGDSAFYNCNKLDGVYITDIEAWCKIEFYKDENSWKSNVGNPLSSAGKLYVNDTIVEDIIIPETITQLNNYVFYNCKNLKVIKLPNSLTTIGNRAFYNCDALTDITIPNSVTSVGDSAFYDCNALQKINLSDNLTTLGSSAFYNCSNLAQINISASVTTIGTDAFLYCDSIEKVNITDLSAWCKLDFSDLDSNPLRCGANLYLNNTLVKELSIPSDISTINKNQFYNCKSITAVKIHSGVDKIEENAFYNCENMEYIEIPKDLFYIRNNAFYGCDNLAEAYYAGTESDWNEIIIADGNDALSNIVLKKPCVITLNLGNGQSKTVSCVPGSTLRLSDVEQKVHHTVKLYTDAAMTKEFDTATAINADLTLYVKLGEWVSDIAASLAVDGTLKVTGSLPNDIADVDCVMFGVYNGKRLLECMDISHPSQNNLNLVIENMQGATKVKLFRWNSFANMTPICEAEDIKIVK